MVRPRAVKPDGHIIDAPHATGRYDAVNRDFSGWMRMNGWGEYQKAAHELRKLAGSRWYTGLGAEYAAKYLGDTIATVFAFYADIDRDRTPLDMRMA